MLKGSQKERKPTSGVTLRSNIAVVRTRDIYFENKYMALVGENQLVQDTSLLPTPHSEAIHTHHYKQAYFPPRRVRLQLTPGLGTRDNTTVPSTFTTQTQYIKCKLLPGQHFNISKYKSRQGLRDDQHTVSD
jgi:hypothetical protein